VKTEITAVPPKSGTWSDMRISGLLGYAAVWAFFIIFLIYPLIRLFYDSLTTESGVFTIGNFQDFFTDAFYLKSLLNSLALGVCTVITTSIIGIAIAFLLLRYDFPGRGLFSYLTIVPMIMPPLVGVMGFVFILGRAGTVNIILQDYFGFQQPVNFMYGLHGVLLVETLHLFPLMTLSIVDAMGKISPSLDEAAESVGSRGIRKFWDITFPLTTPGYVSGALLVFIWTFADFATPLVVGISDLLASQAYLNIVQFVDRRLFKMGIVISAIMVILAILFLIIAKKYVSIKDYSSLSYSVIERKKLSPLGQAGAIAFLMSILIFAFIPYLGLALDSFGKGWALTPFPVKYTLQYFERVAIETPKFMHRRGCARGVGHVPNQTAGTRGSRFTDHADPRPAGNRHRHRLHACIQGSLAPHEYGTHRHVDRHPGRPGGPAASLHGARDFRLAAHRPPLLRGGG
jgi:iron(III) transport system permease protein